MTWFSAYQCIPADRTSYCALILWASHPILYSAVKAPVGVTVSEYLVSTHKSRRRAGGVADSFGQTHMPPAATRTNAQKNATYCFYEVFRKQLYAAFSVAISVRWKAAYGYKTAIRRWYSTARPKVPIPNICWRRRPQIYIS